MRSALGLFWHVRGRPEGDGRCPGVLGKWPIPHPHPYEDSPIEQALIDELPSRTAFFIALLELSSKDDEPVIEPIETRAAGMELIEDEDEDNDTQQ
jgi:hypothetical protein